MKLQINPNAWSCVPTAFAMVLDMPVEDLIKETGHDGSEILYEDLPEPFRRRSFHLQEIVYILVKQKFATFPWHPYRCSSVEGEYMIEDEPHYEELLHLQGVFFGYRLGSSLPHAVAWNGQIIFDPIGARYPYDQFKVEEFWPVVKADFSEVRELCLNNSN